MVIGQDLRCAGEEGALARRQSIELDIAREGALKGRRLERFPYNPARQRVSKAEGDGEEIPLRQRSKWMNAWLVEQFVNWLDGGEAMKTNIEDNLQSAALIFAAIESGRTGQPVKVQELLNQAREDL